MVSRSVAGAALLARVSSLLDGPCRLAPTIMAPCHHQASNAVSQLNKRRQQDRQQDRSLSDESCGSRGACRFEALHLHHNRAREDHLLVQGATRCLPVCHVRLKGLLCCFLARQWQVTSVVSSGLRGTDGQSSLRGSFPASTSAAADEPSVVSLLSAHSISLIWRLYSPRV